MLVSISLTMEVKTEKIPPQIHQKMAPYRLVMDNSGVNRAGRPAGLDSSPSLDSADIIVPSSNLNGISEHSQCAQLPVHIPSTQLPSELYTFTTEMKRMFGELASQVNNKLDRVVNDISAIKHNLEVTKRTVSGIEASLTTTSDQLISIKKEDLPRLRAQLEKKSPSHTCGDA